MCFRSIVTHVGILWNNAGTEFIIALITSVNYGHSAYQLVITSISSSTFVNITIFNTHFEAALTLEEGETTNITIPNSAELLADGISSNSTVIVRSNKPITVFYFSYGWSMAESCSIFPVNLLGTQYYVFSPLYSHGTPEFAIINYDQTNEILITLTGPVNYNGTYYQKGSNLTVVLSAFESLQIQSSASLTGTRIHSEYPIAVLSGNTCDTYSEECNHVLEQLMPSNRWGRTFLVASIAAPNYTDIITIIASQETEITYSGVSNNTVTLQNGESFSIELLSSFSLVVKATERVMVMYTFTGGYYNGYKVNPFIMNIIPIESFSSSYVINVQSNHKNYIHVIAKTSLISEIQHDFANLSLIAVGNFVTKDNYTWAVAELQMINDSIIMKHCTPFAAYIYTIEDSTGMGTTAPSVNRASQCVDFNVTVTLQAYGFIQANWTNDACADNYKLQLSTAEGLYILQEEIIDGTSRIFFGLTVGSVYNLKIWAIIADKMCFPLTKQFKYCGIHMCDSLDLTVTSLANGAIQANWTKIQCVDSYHLQLHKADNSSMLEQKIVNGSMVIFTGPYNHSVYNVTLWAMYSDEQCPPLKKQVTHFGIHMCDSLDLTVTSLANGAIQANWTKIQFVDSYHLQLHKADNSFMLEQKIVNGSMVIFTGPYNHSVYNVTLWAMYSDEQCPPLEKQVTHFGKKTTVIAKAEVLAIGKEPIDEKLIKDAVENEVYDLLKPELHPFVKVRVVQV
ncbi:IgGFc-binding protein-like [Protopterus annectens]|uniref:IgGFc-binding protein-like n=1 Tax=Protopterus annectens TaxID=7888 RepID=UPI001CFC402D|nr:IgGFc-binding protein-like [Protopterus annectens]